jgi:uncharacterized protein (DUF305 family)
LRAEVTGPAEPDLNMFYAGPAGNVLPFVQTADPSARRNPARCSQQLLAELLALNLEMIEQLHVERMSVAGTADFIATMINHHEKAAELLRAQLEVSGMAPA